MFKNGKQQTETGVDSLVGRGTKVRGDLRFVGGCLIDGEVEGNVRADPDSDSVLQISDKGFVEGNVIAPQIVLAGTVHGDVSASQKLRLGSTARVIGNVYYRLIEMAIGAEVNGKLIHQEDVEEQQKTAAELGEIVKVANA